MELPTVSILLPTYNGAQFIAEAIASVQSQSCTSWELIVINDCSTDDTENIVLEAKKKDERIVYVKNEENSGIQKSLNKGLQVAKGAYIARIDDDDRWSDREKMKQQVTFLDEHKEHVLVGTGAIIVDEYKKELTKYLMPRHDADIRKKILSKNCFLHSSVLFKKDAADQFHGYDESRQKKHVEDYDLWLKLGTMGKFANLPTYSVTLMDRTGSLTSQNRTSQAMHMLEEVIAYKKKYPHFLMGYFTSLSRAVFFSVYKYIPFKKQIIYPLKKVYKKYW